MTLAINGGTPVWSGQWPTWPYVSANVGDALSRIAARQRWAVSGDWNGHEPVDLELARRFADYCKTSHCVPVDHGSSALIIGLLGLGVQAGDEVIVPGLTWIATASVVARIGAIPVLVDIDPDTLCISADAVRAAITPRTRAVVAVHLYSAMADMDALRAICTESDLGLVEDCAQAYGAQWDGQPAGSLGDTGAFSTQQGKALTSGEGGLFVTSRDDLRELAEMYRGDGRKYAEQRPRVGRPSLDTFEVVQGWNMHLSEFQAAVLLDGLEALSAADERRRSAAHRLDSAFSETDLAEDFEIIRPHAKNAVRGYYHWPVRLRGTGWDGVDVAEVCDAVSAELGLFAHVTYPPLNRHPLYDPRRLPSAVAGGELDPKQFSLPVANAEAARTVLLHHSVLLASEDAVDAIVQAFMKVAHSRHELGQAAA